MPLTSANMTYFLDEIVTGMAVQAIAMTPSMIDMLFGVRPMTGARKRFASVGGGSLWSRKSASMAEPTAASVVQLYEQDAVPLVYDQKYTLERELVDDAIDTGDYDLIAEYGTQLGDGGVVTMEEQAADVIEDLFNGTTYKCESGISAINDTHTNKGDAATQDNDGANSLNTDGLSATRYAMRSYTDDNGLKAPSRMGLIAIGAYLETTAQQLAKSAQTPEDANNSANVFQGLSYVVLDRVTWTTQWIGLDPVKMKQNLLWLERVPMEIYGRGDLFAGKHEIAGYMRHVPVIRDWRFVYGNAP